MRDYKEPGRWRRHYYRVVEFLKRRCDIWFLLYRFKWNYAHRLDWVIPFPTNIDIEPTGLCNLKCIMCPQAFETISEEDSRMIDLDLARKVIEEAAANGVYSIKFTWRGEPALHRGLVEMVRYCKARGVPEVQFTTNGTPYTERKIRELIEAGLDRIIFSMDGARKETVEKIRVGLDYDRAVANIKAFHRVRGELGRAKPFIRIQMVRMKDNAAEVDAFIEMWKPYADDLRISDVTDRGQGGHLAVGDQVAVGRQRCPQPWQRMVIAPTGEVMPCCADWHKEWVIGDVKNQSLKEIWRGPRMEAMRQVQRDLRLDGVSPCKACFVTESYVWQRAVRGDGR
jgi:radical SAM protein with 4Fe4S-binding SPASM domain